MNGEMLKVDATLTRVLSVFYDYWLTINCPAAERDVCYSWIAPIYAQRFGGMFHQSMLQRLAELGLLVAADSARRGNRRYYKIADLVAVQELIGNSAAAVG